MSLWGRIKGTSVHKYYNKIVFQKYFTAVFQNCFKKKKLKKPINEKQFYILKNKKYDLLTPSLWVLTYLIRVVLKNNYKELLKLKPYI